MATISKYQTASGATLCRVRYRTPENRQTDKRGFTTKRDAEQFANKVEVANKVVGELVARIGHCDVVPRTTDNECPQIRQGIPKTGRPG